METPNYLKLINDAGDLISKIALKVYDTLSEAGTPVNPGKIIQDINDNAFPIIKGTTYFKAELPDELIGVPSDRAKNELFEEQGIELLPKQEDQTSEQEKDLREAMSSWGLMPSKVIRDNSRTNTEGTSVNEPDTKDTSMSEQERWLIEALRDDPHDNRWED